MISFLKKNAWWVALAVILLGIVAGGFFWLSQSALLSIEVIEVEGNMSVSTETVVEIAAPFLQGQGLLHPPLDEAAAALTREPMIEGVEFEREFPHTLLIHIREYHPALNLSGADGAVYLVSTDGVVLMQVETADPTLPVLSTAEPCGEIEPGAAPGCDDANDGITFIGDIPVSFNYEFSGVSVDNGMIRAVTRDGVQVIFGTLEQYDLKFEVLRQMLARASASGAKITIDVSVPERPVTRQGDGATAPNPDAGATGGVASGTDAGAGGEAPDPATEGVAAIGR